MSTENSSAPSGEFNTFYSSGWEYLKYVHDKPSRLFGLHYLEYLQAKRRGLKIDHAPKPATPDQRLVQQKLDHIYIQYYSAADDLDARAG